LEGLFVQILEVAVEMGLLEVGDVALDGTKVKANASKHKALSYEYACELEEQLTEEVEELVAKAEEADAEDLIEVSFDEKTLREVLFGDKGVEVLLENVMNEMMEAELTEHIGAGPSEQTSDRRGYRNGHYQRELTTRVGTLELEVPRDRDGTFSGRTLPAVSALREGVGSGADADGNRGGVDTPGQGDHDRALRTGVQSADGKQPDREVGRAGRSLGRASS
jgi:predicted house-cleaning noncanonical NTP pyrophosphatase (MazG superfamily)